MFRQFIRSPDGIVLPNQIKPKSLMQVLLEGWPKSNRRTFVKQKNSCAGFIIWVGEVVKVLRGEVVGVSNIKFIKVRERKTLPTFGNKLQPR
jgi:hypothetical protein